MKQPKLRWALALLVASGIAIQVRADSIVNNFTTPQNYLLNGIIGDTNWDGVYLRLGDIPGGNNGGDGTGNSLVADSDITFGGFLTVQTVGSSWVGNGDDGFFLYKVVSGDFDASVEIFNPFTALNYNLPGLLARAWNTNLTGSPYAPSSTNGPSENWMYIARFQEFGINEHGRYATNGADVNGYFDTAGDNTDTNSTRYVRLTRVGDVFNFYEKTNQADTWSFITNLTRTDLHGVAMQIGIQQNVGTANTPTTFFTDFELSGTGVSLGTPTLPGAPTALVTTATNIGGSLTLSWTLGNPGDSSLVVMRRNGNIQVNPIQGQAYTADAHFGSSDSLLGGNEYVVYNGNGNSVTVTNLSANIFNYMVAVYEYTNNGALVYNTAAPTTNVFSGPGEINSVNLVPASTNIPVNGATSLRLLANFSTGESNFDETTSTAWGSSDTTLATVDGNGTVTGVASGSPTITATFGTFTPSVVINVTAPFAFTDHFTTTNDYVANGIIGSPYDGLFLNFGDVPGTINAGADGAGFTVAMNSQITDTNGLYLSSVQSDWEGANDDGPFLFKIVPGTNSAVSGDFQASVHINSMNTLNGVVAGIMARTFSPDGSRGPGSANRENHVNYWKVQNGTTSVRLTQVGALTTLIGAGPSAADGWLLIQRVNSTNFYFYERPNTNSLWIFTTNTVLAIASNNAPMEVGVAQQSTAGVNGITTFDTFQLDASGVVSATPLPPPANNLTMTLNGNLSMTLNWVAADGSGNPVPSIVVMRQGAPVSAQPPVGASLTGNSVFGSGSNLGGNNYVVFVSANPPASTNNTVTVTGLTSGQLYYATVYTYAGAGAAKVINPATSATGNLIDASITNIITSVYGGIPQGGIGTVLVQGVDNTGHPLTIATTGATYTSDNTNVIKILSGVLTGITNGSANITTVLGTYSNTINVAVRAPSYTDSFGTPHDYLVDGITNTTWDGLYNPNAATGNPVPGSQYVPLANSGATEALVGPVTNVYITGTNIVVGVSTNITYGTNVSNGLTISSSGDGWENNNSGGFFLFKYVPADFQMSVHILAEQVAAFNQPGILARAYAISNGVPGYPLGYAVTNANGTNDTREYWVDLSRFDEFNIGTYARRNVDGAVSQNTQTDPGPNAIAGPTGPDTNYWLLILRSGDGSQFDFYKRSSMTDAWKQVPNRTHYSIPQLAGRPMQVGVMAGPWNGATPNQLSVSYDNFVLDVLPPNLTAVGSNGLVNVSWPGGGGGSFLLQSSPSLHPANWQVVPGTPVSSNGVDTVTLPMTNSAEFFRLVQ